MAKKVFVVGSVNMDLVISSERLPLIGETIHGKDFFTNPGGKGANQAVAARKLGADVRFCTCVGEDDFGTILTDVLKGYGVDTRYVKRVEGPSGCAVITVVNGDNCIILGAGSNAKLDDKKVDVCLEEAEAGDIMLIQLEINHQTVLHALKMAKEKGMITVLNPAPAQGLKKEFLDYTDILIPNETEAVALGGKENLQDSVEELCKKVDTVIVTVGSKGSIYCHKNERVNYACPKVKAVDTTAAGDTFCGALCARLSMGYSIDEAIKFAHQAASLTVTKKGAQQSIPYEKDVLNAISDK